MYRVTAIVNKISKVLFKYLLFKNLTKLILKFIWKSKSPRICKTALKNRAGRLAQTVLGIFISGPGVVYR